MRVSLERLNIVVYFLFALISWITKYVDLPVTHYAESLLSILVIFVIGGLNVAALLQVALSRRLSRIEFLNVAAAAGFVIVPLINVGGIHFLGEYNRVLVIANSAIVYLFAFVAAKIVFLNYKSRYHNPVFCFSAEDRQKIIFLGIVTVIYLFTIGTIVSSYYALPDLDPYYWMSRTQTCITGTVTLNCLDQRPLFESLNFLFTHAAKVDVYAYFKYVLPFFSLVILLPASLIIGKIKSFSGKMITALLPLAVPSTLLYMLTPMPQAISIILSFFFLYWLLYSRLFSNSFFYYMAGAISFFVYWYHEAGVLFFISWFSIFVLRDRKKILDSLRYNRLVTLLLAVIIFFEFIVLKKPC